MNKTENIRKLFMDGLTLTNIQAYHYASTFKLPDIVYNLRKRGYIISTLIKRDAFGDSYAEYKMTHTPVGKLLL